MYNEVFINTLSERLNEVQEFLKDPKSDFYSTVASILYGKKYEECCEFNADGTANIEGKELRHKVKQMMIPIALECGGLVIEENKNMSTIIDKDIEELLEKIKRKASDDFYSYKECYDEFEFMSKHIDTSEIAKMLYKYYKDECRKAREEFNNRRG